MKVSRSRIWSSDYNAVLTHVETKGGKHEAEKRESPDHNEDMRKSCTNNERALEQTFSICIETAID
jgi:hypothetical protein